MTMQLLLPWLVDLRHFIERQSRLHYNHAINKLSVAGIFSYIANKQSIDSNMLLVHMIDATGLGYSHSGPA